MIEQIAIGKLVLSDLNVRKTERDADIEALAADIEARGLKQNLVAVVNGKAGHYEVVAGGRRFQALEILVDRGVLKKTDKVPVLVEDRDQGVETSLAENLHRVAMNPADELEAFRTIIDGAEGSEAERIAYCAKRFGVTVRHVEQRLRLADLIPEVLDLLRAGRITLDMAKAFATTADQDRQREVFRSARLGEQWGEWNTHQVRRVLTEGSVTNADPRAILVGRSTYEAEGGRVDVDLFAAVGTERWIDVPLLTELATKEMAAAAVEIQAREGFAMVMHLLDHTPSYELTNKLDNWYPGHASKIDPATEAAIAALTAEQEQLSDQLNAGGDFDEDEEGRPLDEALSEAWDRYAAIDEEKDRLREAAEAAPIPAEKKARFRRFLVLGTDGKPKLSDGWYSDVKVDRNGDPVATTRSAASSTGPAGGLSEALSNELAMQRRDVLAVMIAQSPAIATAYGQFVVVDRLVGQRKGAYPRPGSALQVDSNDLWEPVGTAYIEGDRGIAHLRDSQARQSLAWVEEQLDWSWCDGLDREPARPGSSKAEKEQLLRFDRFRALPDEDREALFAWAVAKSLKASSAIARQDEVHDRLGELLGIDVAQWWRPTGANYFARLNLDGLNVALIEMSEGTAHRAGKKGDLVKEAETLARGELTTLSPHVNGLGKRWVPEAMRFRAMKPAGGEA